MCVDLNAAFFERGTRFLVYPQAPVLESIGEPELIWVSPHAGSVQPGPADDRMFVSDALDKTAPYEVPYLPPYAGRTYPPARPNAQGHFDHLHPDSREFNAAHMYAIVRRVLDVWEHYIGHPIVWHFRELFDRLELVPIVHWDNAQSGFGFIETGYRENADGQVQLFCLNFDVLAHEIGHSIIYSEVGTPWFETETAEYFGFQESAADMAALISALHFETIVDRLLNDTSGNLRTLNELNRVAELSENEQIRVVENTTRMSDYARGWEKEHHLSQPLTGALFDILVGAFHDLLVERRLIDEDLARAAEVFMRTHAHLDDVQRGFDLAYQGEHVEFKRALLDARDYVGQCLGRVWTDLSPHFLRYVDVGHQMLAADEALFDGRFNALVFGAFRRRQIGTVDPGPRLVEPPPKGARSCR